ncbi:carboxymuconolactone decarboxylase family protein [Streptomyces sp. NPDC060194]|uniref:carboxymuconolactone decarboxylase family protein n=1 Tax=Streptomyces sp. NPDC060194 TaxID=3347069 RepID=UPI003657B484
MTAPEPPAEPRTPAAPEAPAPHTVPEATAAPGGASAPGAAGPWNLPASGDPFASHFQRELSRSWDDVRARPGLDRRTRSAVALTALVAGRHFDALGDHIRTALRDGLTAAEIREVIIQTSVHCGVHAAGTAFRIAAEVAREESAAGE